MKKRSKILLIIILIIILSVLFFLYKYNLYKKELKEAERLKLIEEKRQSEIVKMKDSYGKYVITIEDANLYKKENKKYKKIGKISKDIVLSLADIDIDNSENLYFKLENLDYYIKYNSVNKQDDYKESFNSVRYRNYIPFNESIELNNFTLYIDENKKYEINDDISLAIIIKDTDRYYVEYDNRLMYVLKSDNDKIISNNNSDAEISEHFAIVNYHYIVSKDDKTCNTSLCTSFEDFDSHLKYLKDNNYFTITMEEVEKFIDGKINLPKKSVGITIDDGWYATNAIQFLEKYDMKATLFLIGEIYDTHFSKESYLSEHLDIHSHGYDLHEPGYCKVKGTRGGAILCMDHDSLVNDLKKSSEWLNNTTIFCYPFYEYNEHAIEALKDAGYTLALAGGGKDVYRNSDKYKVPRYGLTSHTTVSNLAQIISY